VSDRRSSEIVSRISISEEDLGATPAVYARVPGSTPDVYSPVDAASLTVEGASKIATWVLVVSALVLAIAFGVGGFVLGQSGRVSQEQVQSTRATDRARFEADERAAIATATTKVRRAETARAERRARAARSEGITKGRKIGRNEAIKELQNAVPAGSISTDDCLTAVQFCDY
jgi:uncharacterized protein HemX